MECVCCGSAAVTERPERTAQGYRRFRCRDCGRQFNERSAGVLNRAQYPSDVIALVVLWRLRYRLTLRDLCEMFLQRGLVFSHEAVREWEAKLAPVLADELRRRRRGKGGARPPPLACRRDIVSGRRLGSLLRHEAGSARTRRETTSLSGRSCTRPLHCALDEIGR